MKNNEFNYIKYLFSYKRGVVISEQKNVVSEQTVAEINPKGLKLGDTGPDVVELQQKLIDMDRLIATKDWKSRKKGEKWTKPTGNFGVDTADALAKLEAEQNKPIEIQQPKLATIEQYPCLTDDNKSKWGKSIFYADGKVLLQGNDAGYEKTFSCGEDGSILVDGKKMSDSLPKFTQVVQKGINSEFIDANKKYKIDKRPTGSDQVSSPIIIDYNINKTLFVFVAWIYETISEDETKFIYMYSDGTAEGLKKGADYLSDKASSVEKTGTFEYDGTNLTFSWGNPEETTETQTFPFASQEEYTQFKEWMKKSNPTVYTDMGGTGEPNEWNSVMAKVYEKLKTDWETYKQLLVQTVVSETKKEWFYQDENKKVTGPFTKDELLETIKSNPSALVWRKKMSAWTKAGNIRSLGLSDDDRETPPPVRTRNQNLRGTVGYPITTKDKEPPPTRK